jgi:hypothetical protein
LFCFATRRFHGRERAPIELVTVYSSNQYANSPNNAYVRVIFFAWLLHMHHLGILSVTTITLIHVALYALPTFQRNHHRATINLTSSIRKHRMSSQQDETFTKLRTDA